MRQLVINNIVDVLEGCGDLQSQNSVLLALGYDALPDFDDAAVMSALAAASDEDILLAYEVQHTAPCDWVVWFGEKFESIL